MFPAGLGLLLWTVGGPAQLWGGEGGEGLIGVRSQPGTRTASIPDTSTDTRLLDIN